MGNLGRIQNVYIKIRYGGAENTSFGIKGYILQFSIAVYKLIKITLETLEKVTIH